MDRVRRRRSEGELAIYLLNRGCRPEPDRDSLERAAPLLRTRRMNTRLGPFPSGSVDRLDVLKKMIAAAGDINARISTTRRTARRNAGRCLFLTHFLCRIGPASRTTQPGRLAAAAGDLLGDDGQAYS